MYLGVSLKCLTVLTSVNRGDERRKRKRGNDERENTKVLFCSTGCLADGCEVLDLPTVQAGRESEVITLGCWPGVMTLHGAVGRATRLATVQSSMLGLTLELHAGPHTRAPR